MFDSELQPTHAFKHYLEHLIGSRVDERVVLFALRATHGRSLDIVRE